MSFKNKLLHAAHKSGGSSETVKARQQTIQNFTAYLKEKNIQLKQADRIRARYIGQYIKEQKERGISIRSLQNQMAHFRAVLATTNNKFKIPTNEQLGLIGANRDGVRVAMPLHVYEQARASLLSAGKNGTAAVLALQKELGLRSGEAIQSHRSLKTWENLLQAGAEKVQVLHGTKGGRSREAYVLNPEKALEAVREALQVVSQGNGKLIHGKDLIAARNAFQRDCRSVGLKGKYSPHSLRYRYAQERVQQLEKRGYDQREARSAVAQDLGHGSGRDRWVNQVYLKNN